ncbi:MAG: hypothetical protein U0354_02495 [Candidatus Sericytochromatia bacterium]
MNFRINSGKLTPPSELFKKNFQQSENTKPILSGLGIKKDSTNFSPILKNNSNINNSFSIFNLIKPTQNNVSTNSIFNSSTSKIEGIPSRKSNAMTGSQFIEATKNMNRTEREKMILKEVTQGNIPDFMRNLKQISISIKDNNGISHTAKISVMPDYIAIGSNNDFVRMPMSPITAQKIADKTGTILPTKKMVDDIYKSSEVKLNPQPLPAGATMMSNQYYKKHNEMVENQISEKGVRQGQLISGHQKDVVITNRLDNKPTQVAIYGWHQKNGKPIQPLSTVHENTYADYSHGVRLVSSTVIVDGKKMNIKDVLKDPNLSKLLSDEGAISNTRASR